MCWTYICTCVLTLCCQHVLFYKYSSTDIMKNWQKERKRLWISFSELSLMLHVFSPTNNDKLIHSNYSFNKQFLCTVWSHLKHLLAQLILIEVSPTSFYIIIQAKFYNGIETTETHWCLTFCFQNIFLSF